jgi:hypothetical protein
MFGGQRRSLAWWSMKDPMLGGQRRIPCLVVNEGSHVWWSMKIPCLVVNEDPLLGGQWEEKKKVTCYLFPLPLEQLI